MFQFILNLLLQKVAQSRFLYYNLFSINYIITSFEREIDNSKIIFTINKKLIKFDDELQ